MRVASESLVEKISIAIRSKAPRRRLSARGNGEVVVSEVAPMRIDHASRAGARTDPTA